ncbi:MAG TPA: AraC family transcriptional regulator ligand-binding domain-containing protein [Sorangium sp.]|nr:AraC family transcriptional regulator ligand-binding domain-containing protein [Sorangium sp.]
MDIMTNVGSPTVSSEFTRAFLDTSAVLGLSTPKIARKADLHENLIACRGARLPVDRFRVAWLAAERESGPLYGLRAAEAMRPGALDVIDYMMSSSATCGAALTRLIRYAPLLGNAARLSLSCHGDVMKIRYDCPGGLAETVEFSFAIIVLRLRALARSGSAVERGDIHPRSISFCHSRRGDLDFYARIFGAPIHFHQHSNELVLRRGLFEAPVETSDPRLLNILEDCANASLERVQPTPMPSTCLAEQELSAIRECVRSAMREGSPSIYSTAKLLGMSPRTIQRRLQEHGTSYREIVHEIRAALMAEVLSSEQPTRSRLAQVLAYSSERSVDRAYRRMSAEARSFNKLSPRSEYNGTAEFLPGGDYDGATDYANR